MSRFARAAFAAACAASFTLAGLSPSVAAPTKGDRVTQESCQAQGGTFSSSKGTKSCTTTSTTTTVDPTPRYASGPLDDGTYYTGIYQRETDTTTTTTTSQRGNQSPTTESETTTVQRNVVVTCYRVDDYHEPTETVTVVDNTECSSRDLAFIN